MTLQSKILNTALRSSVVLTLVFGSLHADSVTNLTDELIELRSEVEALHAELDEAKDGYKSKMKSLAMQKSELEANIRREETRIKQLNDNIKKQRDLIAKNSEGSRKLIPIVVEAAELLEKEVKASLPFKKEDRLNALNDIKTGVQAAQFTPERAANKLWAFYEDEIRLTKENGVFRQSININGEERLVDVARVGMVAMFFKTSDDAYGYVTRQNGDWAYVITEDSDEKEQIAGLFDAFKKQIRTGFFTIPNQLPKMEIR